MQQRSAYVVGAVGIVVALAVGGVALGLSASGQAATAPGSCGGSAPKLTVQGTGEASATPDLLTLSIGIDVTDGSAQAALADDNAKAAAVTGALEHGGVADKDIQTTDVSIQPHYSLTGTITGYEMTNTLTAKLRTFSTSGAVVDAVTAAAGNAARIDSLTFSIEDPRVIEDRARTDAVHQAVSHARSMASAAGQHLGPVCSLTDDTSSGISANLREGFASSVAAVPSMVPLQAGTQQISAQITLIYEITNQIQRGS